MAATSIGYQLGIGSGLDVKSLVDNLAAAAKAPKEAQIVKREEANAAKVSHARPSQPGHRQLRLGSSSLISRRHACSASRAFPIRASSPRPRFRGARLGGLSASIEVIHLAQAQTLSSAALAGAHRCGRRRAI